MASSEGHGPRGRVHLVGAGPGDPGLLTARALELIARADTILYDRLIPATALEGASPAAELLFVGKQGGGESVPQEHTQRLLIDRALAGREVVRLKGGDPFVFGRGGEEALALREAGIEFTIVPGVTAGVAAPACAGIPVTHRGLATGVAFVTGHTQAGVDGDAQELAPDVDFEALARFPGTLVFYMSVRALGSIAASLLRAGRDGDEPAALVERGTLPDQRVIAATLASLAEVAERERVKAPTIAVIGQVAALADRIAWRPRGPLAGTSVAVTRARARASELARRLQALGASVVQAPSIRTLARPSEPIDPTPYDLVCLTSPVGVELLFERLDDGRHPRGDARALARTRVAAIGPGTARALAERGILADVVPERYVAEALVEALAGVEVGRALVGAAAGAREVLPDALRARGAQVEVVALYDTVAEPLTPAAREQARRADYVTFTSASAVRFFLQALASGEGEAPETTAQGGEAGSGPSASDTQRRLGAGALSEHTRAISIGPVTSAALREHGIEPHVEARRHDVDGLIDALLADAAERATDRDA
ncbi:MAG TPA: uroporphyrinogen-III C-methyltransferase [Solirubrobacteraceae bacterium]|nr:uroporphyrinogen-III C-methyltransferase [Solirubrobacteraceae bacterium]